MSEKRFYYLTHNLNEDDEYYEIIDKAQRYSFNFIKDEWLATQVCDYLNEQQNIINEQDKEIDLLRLELDTHKHPLWSTREAERKVNKLADSLADEVKKNGLLNEEINQLKIENMRLKKKGGDGI